MTTIPGSNARRKGEARIGLLRAFGVRLASLAALLVMPAFAAAEALAFRNDTSFAVVVQAAHQVQGNVQRDRPHLLQPNEGCRIVLPGTKLISIYNARMPNHVLHQATFPAGTEDLYFSIRFDAAQGKVIIERVKPPQPR